MLYELSSSVNKKPPRKPINELNRSMLTTDSESIRSGTTNPFWNYQPVQVLTPDGSNREPNGMAYAPRGTDHSGQGLYPGFREFERQMLHKPVSTGEPDKFFRGGVGKDEQLHTTRR